MNANPFTLRDTALVGVIAPLGKGVAGTCVACRKGDLDRAPQPCSGFGPGCLAPAREPQKR